MKVLGRVLKFMFPKTVERMVRLDELLTEIVGIKISQRHHHSVMIAFKLAALRKEYNDTRMWFMSKV